MGTVHHQPLRQQKALMHGRTPLVVRGLSTLFWVSKKIKNWESKTLQKIYRSQSLIFAQRFDMST